VSVLVVITKGYPVFEPGIRSGGMEWIKIMGHYDPGLIVKNEMVCSPKNGYRGWEDP